MKDGSLYVTLKTGLRVRGVFRNARCGGDEKPEDPTVKRTKTALALACALLCVFYLSGCAKRTQLPDPRAEAGGKIVSVESMLERARAEGAQDTWEYGEAARLLERARALMEQGDFEGAAALLSEAEINAVMALGAARSMTYMSGVDEDAQELQKSMLEEAFSSEAADAPGVSDVFFEFDSSKISERARGTLNSNADALAADAENIRFVVVAGFCDTRGTEEYNLSLGKKRAEQVRKYMIGRGVSPSTIHSVSKGETDMWQKGTSEESYGKNRRAHFRVLFK